jgi:hypothetical protein
LFRTVGPGAVLALLACAAFSAQRAAPSPPKPQPTEVKIISAPPAVPTEVKIISTPPARVDESARSLVKATWWLLGANAVLCIATFGGSWLQSGDTKRRDRAAMEREINRSAQRNMANAARLDHLAQEVPVLINRIHRLAGNVEIPDWWRKDIEETLQTRQKQFSFMKDRSLEIISSDLPKVKARSNEVVRLLWTVDSHEVQLEVMREAVTAAWCGSKGRFRTFARNKQRCKPAHLAAPKPPPRTTLG